MLSKYLTLGILRNTKERFTVAKSGSKKNNTVEEGRISALEHDFIAIEGTRAWFCVPSFIWSGRLFSTSHDVTLVDATAQQFRRQPLAYRLRRKKTNLEVGAKRPNRQRLVLGPGNHALILV